jgi:hypothetical protein
VALSLPLSSHATAAAGEAILFPPALRSLELYLHREGSQMDETHLSPLFTATLHAVARGLPLLESLTLREPLPLDCRWSSVGELLHPIDADVVKTLSRLRSLTVLHGLLQDPCFAEHLRGLQELHLDLFALSVVACVTFAQQFAMGHLMELRKLHLQGSVHISAGQMLSHTPTLESLSLVDLPSGSPLSFLSPLASLSQSLRTLILRRVAFGWKIAALERAHIAILLRRWQRCDISAVVAAAPKALHG